MLSEEIQSAVKNKNAVIGYRESVKFIKLSSPKLIVVANNIPEGRKREIEHNAKLSQSEFEIFGGTSRELGTFCGVPYPVSVLVVKG
jgi:ribosomal protein L30E